MVAVLYEGVPEEIDEIVGAVESEEEAAVVNVFWEEIVMLPEASRERTL